MAALTAALKAASATSSDLAVQRALKDAAAGSLSPGDAAKLATVAAPLTSLLNPGSSVRSQAARVIAKAAQLPDEKASGACSPLMRRGPAGGLGRGAQQLA
jgi:hypothetical protein